MCRSWGMLPKSSHTPLKNSHLLGAGGCAPFPAPPTQRQDHSKTSLRSILGAGVLAVSTGITA